MHADCSESNLHGAGGSCYYLFLKKNSICLFFPKEKSIFSGRKVCLSEIKFIDRSYGLSHWSPLSARLWDFLKIAIWLLIIISPKA